jgi:uncharacterized membrane protein (DUF485 family)
MDHSTRPSAVRSPRVPSPQPDTGSLPVMFGGPQLRSTAPRQAEQAVPAGPDFEQIQRSPEFAALRKRHRRFVFPMSLLFFAWYLSFVLLAAYAHDFMSIKILGEINIGIALGVLQFLTTIAITVAYLRFARNQMDPQVAALRRNAGVTD